MGAGCLATHSVFGSGARSLPMAPEPRSLCQNLTSVFLSPSPYGRLPATWQLMHSASGYAFKKASNVDVCGKSYDVKSFGFPWHAVQLVGWLCIVKAVPKSLETFDGWHAPHQRDASWPLMSTFQLSGDSHWWFG